MSLIVAYLLDELVSSVVLGRVDDLAEDKRRYQVADHAAANLAYLVEQRRAVGLRLHRRLRVLAIAAHMCCLIGIRGWQESLARLECVAVLAEVKEEISTAQRLSQNVRQG